MPKDNSTIGEQPNPWRMEPPPWPAVSTTQPQAPAPTHGQTRQNKNTNMGTSHTERDSVEADKIRLKPNNNSNNSNKENHQNHGMTKIIICDGERKRIQTRPYALVRSKPFWRTLIKSIVIGRRDGIGEPCTCLMPQRRRCN